MDLNLVPTFVRYAGAKPFHTVCLPGMVPDGPETFARQRRVLRARGSLSIATYPYAGFDLDAVVEAVRREIATAAASGSAPILLGLSVGGGIAIEVLRRALESGRPLPLAGVVLVSPMSCAGDLSPLLKRFMGPIVEAGEADSAVAVERGRAFFKSLVSRSADGKAPALPRWLGPVGRLTPQGYVAWWESRVLARIHRTLEGIPPAGALARVRALRSFRGIEGLRGPLCEAPTLLLWGSKERQTLDMEGPGTSRLCRPDLAGRIFPDAEVHWVYDRDGGEVPHASMLKHAAAFNPLLKRWLDRQARARQVGMVRAAAQTMASFLPVAALAGTGR